ncbi:MAG: thioredoxin family protein [Sphingomonas sp.]|nr:thioredoxin family protein [Sphingomonas sp.]
MRRLLILIALLFASPALAQLPPPGANAIAPELVAETRAVAGQSVDLAIVMHTRPGWHGYWLNPGDAGLPMRAEWSLPAGASVGPLRYPVPTRLTIAGLMNYVYERDHAILVRLNVPGGATGPIAIRAKLDWLACTDKVCVPERGEVSLDVPLSGPATTNPRFNEWRRALPRPLASPARFARFGDRIEVALALPASVTLGEPYIFPADDGVVNYAAPQSFRRDGDTLIASLKSSGKSPAGLSGVLALGDGRGLSFTATPGTVPSGGRAIGDLGITATLFAVLGALVGGMLLNLMPCVFPILALKALHLARSRGNEATARRDALAYAAGAVVGTGLLGGALLAIRAGGTTVGWAFQLQDPRTIVFLLLLVTAITLNLLRTFELPVLASETQSGGSFGTGALAAFVATPCAGPFLGVALGTALLLPATGSVLVFAALGLGLALPFVMVAFVPALRRLLPRPGPWMVRLQRFLAIPMAATAAGSLWLLWRQGGVTALTVGLVAVALLTLLLIWTGWRQRRGEQAGLAALVAALIITGAAASLIPSRSTNNSQLPPGVSAWSAAAVAREQAAGRPSFVYFTADWCLTCKVNEAGAINRDEVQDAFRKAKVKMFVGDWTNGDPAITRLLDARARAGVPLYLWYEPGSDEPEELPQILTPDMLSGRALRARR